MSRTASIEGWLQPTGFCLLVPFPYTTMAAAPVCRPCFASEYFPERSFQSSALLHCH